MSNVAPLSLLSAVVALDSTLDHWELLEPAGGVRRSCVQPIVFERQFAVPPLLHLGLVGIDSSKDDNLRLSLRAENITQYGFSLRVETWLNTKIWSVEVSWLAIGS